MSGFLNLICKNEQLTKERTKIIKLKKILAIGIAAIMTVSAVVASAEENDYLIAQIPIEGDQTIEVYKNDFEWSINANGELTVKGSGAMPVWESEAGVPWYDKRENIKSVVTGENITDVGEYAFSGCENLQVINDTTYIPVRFVAETLGYTVIWN